MTVAELMTGRTPSEAFRGYSTADDQVLAIDFTGTATDVNEYIVAQVGITEASGSLEAQTQDSQYLRTGNVTTKTGTSRVFSVTGDRSHGDPFQDAILDHELKYGTGQSVIRPFAYFDRLTGTGEKGNVSITIEDDFSGAAGENASFSVSMSSTAIPDKYTYEPPTP